MHPRSRARRAALVIASNRGPVEFRDGPHGGVVQRRGAGGLIAVLGPALAASHGIWVTGALSEADRAVARAADAAGELLAVDLPQGPVAVRSLDLDPGSYAAFYGPIATQTLWFLHHHLFDPAYEPAFGSPFRADWAAYERINDAFAAACAEEVVPGGTVLLQDYHLSAAPALLRARRPDVRIAHSTMCPWADPDYFAILPQWTGRRLVEGMLGADLLSFLVPRWADNFLACCRALGYDVDAAASTVRGPAGVTSVRTYPIGVDVAQLRARTAQRPARDEARRVRALVGDRRLVLRVDRMEPAKNVLRGVRGFAELLAADPALHGRVLHYVLAYSSRSGLPDYRRFADEVHAAVRETNQRFGTDSWQPVVLDTENNFDRGLALMRRADVLVVNPLRDGMNLVAKEGPAVSEQALVLILSRDAGAAEAMADGALLVNPFDTVELAEAMATALAMPPAERRRRLAALRTAAGALPPARWLARMLTDLDGVAGRAIRPIPYAG